MSLRSKLTLAGLTATLALVVAVSQASANRLSLNRENFRIVWTSLEFSETGNTTRCPVTMEGSFHSGTIAKVREAPIAAITRATVTSASCVGGNATILQASLPWGVTYQGFTGTLPVIGTIAVWVINMQVLIRTMLTTCLLTTTTREPGRAEIGVETGGLIQTSRFTRVTGITQIAPNGRFECPQTIATISSPAGDGQVTVQGTMERIQLRLI